MERINLQKIVKVLDKYQDLINCEDVEICSNVVSFYAPSCNASLIINMLSPFGSVNCTCNNTSKVAFYFIQ